MKKFKEIYNRKKREYALKLLRRDLIKAMQDSKYHHAWIFPNSLYLLVYYKKVEAVSPYRDNSIRGSTVEQQQFSIH